MNDPGIRTLTPAQLHTLKAQSLSAIEMLDAAEAELKNQSEALEAMRAQVRQTMAQIDASLIGGGDMGADAVRAAVSKAQSDPVFRKRLISHPTDALNDLGIKTPNGVKFTFIEDSATEQHVVIPLLPLSTSLRQFLTNLAANAKDLAAFVDDPEAAMKAAGLSEVDKETLRAGNYVELYRNLDVSIPKALREASAQLGVPTRVIRPR